MSIRKEIFTALAGRVQEMAARARAERDTAQREANSHIGAMASRYDTFKEEAQYLAGAQQKRLEELMGALAKIEAILGNEHLMREDFSKASIGCIITLQDEQTGVEQKMVISPALGGEEIRVGTNTYMAVTFESPIGKALRGAQIEDQISLKIANKDKYFTVLAIL